MVDSREADRSNDRVRRGAVSSADERPGDVARPAQNTRTSSEALTKINHRAAFPFGMIRDMTSRWDLGSLELSQVRSRTSGLHGTTKIFLFEGSFAFWPLLKPETSMTL